MNNLSSCQIIKYYLEKKTSIKNNLMKFQMWFVYLKKIQQLS